ncbi:MAG: TolC family protein, partial [Bacteroidales bacterium]|nr:TolC family protein [Bacteroidales bacterium]MBN2756000.1 TolC family protein [Bacteroidales bacterium]
MRKLLILTILLNSFSVFAQNIDSLDLGTCKSITINKYPISKDLEFNIEANRKKIENLKSIYYPILDLTTQYTTQSDVPHMTIENPFFTLPVVGKEQYKVQLEIKQLIYDGGISKILKTIEYANLQADNQNIHVSIYMLNEQINDVYFLILLFQEQQKLLKLTKATIENQLQVVESGVKNGVLLPGEADVMKVEILKIEQNIAELNSGRISGIEVLAELMDTTLTEKVFLSIPEVEHS